MANTGVPNIGQAIGLQNSQFNPLDHILSSMKEGDKLIEEDAARRKAAHAERQKRLEKNQDDLDTILITNKDIDPMFQPHIASETKEFRNYIDEQQNNNENYRWQGDIKALLKLQELQNHTRNAETTTKGFIDESNKLAKLHPDDVEQSDEQKAAMDAIHNHDLEGYIKASKSPDGFGNPSLYSLKDKSNDFLPSLISTMSKITEGAPVEVKKLPNGTTITERVVDPDNVKLGYKTYVEANPKFAKFRQNAVTTGQYQSLQDFDNAWLSQAGIFAKREYKQSQDQSPGAQAAKNYSFSEPTQVTSKSDVYHKGLGQPQDYLQVTLTKTKGGKLPTDTYKNGKGQDVVGFSTGEFLQDKKTNKVVAAVAVPDKSLTTGTDWTSKTDEEKEAWLQDQYETDPNKFAIENIPLDVEFNKNKIKTAFGKGPDEMFGNTSNTSKSYKVKGKSYTHSELNKLGYTDEQISAAQKAGTIK